MKKFLIFAISALCLFPTECTAAAVTNVGKADSAENKDSSVDVAKRDAPSAADDEKSYEVLEDASSKIGQRKVNISIGGKSEDPDMDMEEYIISGEDDTISINLNLNNTNSFGSGTPGDHTSSDTVSGKDSVKIIHAGTSHSTDDPEKPCNCGKDDKNQEKGKRRHHGSMQNIIGHWNIRGQLKLQVKDNRSGEHGRK